MKRIVYFASICMMLTFLLLGCSGISPQPDGTTYNLSISNFESFFDVQAELVENGDVTDVQLTVTQTFNGTTSGAVFSAKVYVDQTFQNARDLTFYSFSKTLSETEEVLTMSTPGGIVSQSLFYVEITGAGGQVNTTDTILITPHTYDVPEYTDGYTAEENQAKLDAIENQANYDLLEAAFTEFNDMFYNESHDYLQMSTRSYVTTRSDYYNDSELHTTSVKLTTDLSYIEQKIDNDMTVYKRQGNDFYVYEYDASYTPYMIYINPYVLTSGSQLEDLTNGIVPDDEYTFDPSTMHFTVTDQGYLMVGYLKDAMPTADYNLFKQTMVYSGFSENDIEQSQIKIAFEFSLDQLIQTVTIKVDHSGDYNLHITSEVQQTISTKSFTKVDFTDGKFVITPADEFNEVVETTDFTEALTGRGNPQHYLYKTYLEPGQYILNNPENNLRYMFYDANENEVDLNPLPYSGNGDYDDTYIFIRTAGYYFVSIYGASSTSFDGYSLSIDKINFDTYYDANHPDVVTTGTYHFVSEGIEDFVALRLSVSQPTLIKITPQTEDDITVIYSHENYYTYHEWSYDSLYIVMKPNDPIITLHSDVVYEIDLDISIVDTTTYQTQDMNNMIEITDTYSLEPVYASDDLGTGYLKLIVTEKAYYTLQFDVLKNLSTPYAYIYNAAGERLSNNSINNSFGIVLEPGTYTVSVDSFNVAGAYIKYEKVLYEQTVNYDLTLQETNIMNIYDDSFPESINFYFYDAEQVYNGWFTLTEQQTILITGNDWKLFTDQDELIGVYYADTYFNGTYFKLDAGTYYVQKLNVERGYPNADSIHAVIYTGTLSDDNLYGSQVTDLTLGQDYHLTKDNNYDTELFKLVVDQNTTYTTSNQTGLTVYVYDTNGHKVASFYQSEQLTLEAGTYYIYISYLSSSATDIRFTISN